MTRSYFPALLFAAVLTANAETLVMPRELVDDARKHGCDQVANFFDYPGSTGPPYTYGYPIGSAGTTAIYWCQLPAVEKSEPKYMLRVWSPPEQPVVLPCLAQIDWWNGPAGLSIRVGQETSLDGFAYIDEPKRTLNPGLSTSSAAIISERDGLEATFICYEGKWIFEIRD